MRWVGRRRVGVLVLVPKLDRDTPVAVEDGVVLVSVGASILEKVFPVPLGKDGLKRKERRQGHQQGQGQGQGQGTRGGKGKGKGKEGGKRDSRRR
jgi:hypothetical protein